MKQKDIFRAEIQQNKAPPKGENPVVEGKKEGIKELVKEVEKSKQKLDDLLERTHTCLYQIKTVFPFDLFPSTISVDENKLDVVDRIFFASDVRSSVPVRDVKSVNVESNLFFSTIHIVIDMPQDNAIVIGPLKKAEAIRMKQIVQGLSICIREKIDVSSIEDKELLYKVEELGKTQGL